MTPTPTVRSMKILFRVSSDEDLLEDREELIAEGEHAAGPALGKIALQAADAGVARGETRAGQLLEELVEFFALGEANT